MAVFYLLSPHLLPVFGLTTYDRKSKGGSESHVILFVITFNLVVTRLQKIKNYLYYLS